MEYTVADIHTKLEDVEAQVKRVADALEQQNKLIGGIYAIQYAALDEIQREAVAVAMKEVFGK
jgi:hypothetical protein